MMFIVACDSITLLAAVIALVFLAIGWKQVKGPDIRILLAVLFLLTLFYAFCLWVEWVGFSRALDTYEDYTGAVMPMAWGFVFYAFIQREMTRNLRRSEENLRVTLDSIGDGVITTTRQGRIVRMNSIAEALTGWKLEEARDRPLSEVFGIVNARTKEPVANPVAKVMETGHIVGLANHTALISRDGRERQIADSGAPIKDSAGRIMGVVLVFRDVTENYHMQEELQENERFLQSVFHALQDGLSVLDPDLNIVRVNTWMQRMYAHHAPLEGRKCYAVYQRRDAVCPWCPSVKALATGGSHSAEAPYPSAETPEGWVDLTAFPIKNEKGEVTGVIEYVKDITDRKESEAALRQSEERYKTIVSSMSDLIFVLDEDDRFVDIHCRSADDLILPPAEFLGKKMDDVMPPHVSALYRAAAIDVRKSGENRRYEYSLPIAERERWFSASLDLHTDGRRIVAGIRDVTDRRQAEESLVRARDELVKYATELELSNRELEDFAYIASHDLKEPLRGIHNYSSFLLEDYEDRLDEDGQSKLHALMRLTQRLESLLDDLLHYSRVGRIDLAMRQVDSGALVREVMETMDNLFDEQNVRVTIAADMPPVLCDRASVGEVFRNLISNAVKYNDNKIRQVDIGWEEGDDAERIVLYVRDNGIGISEKHLEKVFKIFKRLHGRDQYGGGTGSGLTLARRIIERHGGAIRATSAFGKGSTFLFTLPRGKKDE